MKKVKLLFLLLFSILVIVPIITFNYKKDQVSELDNRMLNELTNLEPSTIDDYVSDRIGLRSQAIQAYNSVNANIFGVLTHPNYMFGVTTDEIFSKRNDSYTYDDYFVNFIESLEDIQEYCESREKKFYFVLNPSKNNVYTEYLNETINYDSSWIESFINNVEERNINFIDNYTYLNSIKNDERIYCYKYDPDHWNDTGAFYGVNNMLSRISVDFEGVTLNKDDDFDKEEKTRKYLPESNYQIDEITIEYNNKKSIIDRSDEFTHGLNRDAAFSNFEYYESDNKNGLTCLVFASSFLFTNHRAEKFVANQFETSIYIHNYQNIYDIDYYLNIFNPDLVIFEVADFTFNDYYFDTSRMESMNIQPTLDLSLYSLSMEENYIKLIPYSDTKYETLLIYKQDVAYDYAYIEVDGEIYDVRNHDESYMEVSFLGDYIDSANEIYLYLVDEDTGVVRKYNTYF